MDKKMITAVYCRTARADDERIAAQKEQVSEYARKQSHGEIAVFIDNGESGSGMNRPAMNRLNAEVQAGNIDAVYVHSFSHIGRNVYEVVKWLDGLRDKGIVIKAVDGSLDDVPYNTFYDAYLEYHRKYSKGGKQYGS